MQLSDSFKLNRHFRSRLKKIVLEEELALGPFQELLVTAGVKRMRALTIRSAVMRVLKRRRASAHRELTSEVQGMVTQFKATSRVRLFVRSSFRSFV